MGRKRKYTEEENEGYATRAIERIDSIENAGDIFLHTISAREVAREVQKEQPQYALADALKPEVQRLIDLHNRRVKDFIEFNLTERKKTEKFVTSSASLSEYLMRYKDIDIAWKKREEDFDFLCGATMRDKKIIQKLQAEVKQLLGEKGDKGYLTIIADLRDERDQAKELLRIEKEKKEAYAGELDRLREQAIIAVEQEEYYVLPGYKTDTVAEGMTYLAELKNQSARKIKERRDGKRKRAESAEE